MRYHDQCNLAICLTVSQPVYFTWQCDIRYHNQCIPPGIHWLWYRMTHCQVKYTGCGTVRHIARMHWSWYRMTLSPVKGTGRPVPFTWQCVMLHHDQCILAICLTGPQPVYFIWKCVMWYHNQCISPGNVLCGTTTNIVS
jgi:hypothetical protein